MQEVVFTVWHDLPMEERVHGELVHVGKPLEEGLGFGFWFWSAIDSTRELRTILHELKKKKKTRGKKYIYRCQFRELVGRVDFAEETAHLVVAICVAESHFGGEDSWRIRN